MFWCVVSQLSWMASFPAGISTSRANALNQVIARYLFSRHFWIFTPISIVSECVARIHTSFSSFFKRKSTPITIIPWYLVKKDSSHGPAFMSWLTGHLVANFVWMLREVVSQILSRVTSLLKSVEKMNEK